MLADLIRKGLSEVCRALDELQAFRKGRRCGELPRRDHTEVDGDGIRRI